MKDRISPQPTDTAAPSRLFAAYRDGRLSRRQFMLRAAAFGFSAAAINAFLIACGGDATATTGPSGAATTGAATTAGGATTAAGGATTAATARGTATTTGAGAGAAGTTARATGGSPVAGGGNTYGFKPGGGSDIDRVEIKSPVEITLWHTQTRANEEKLKKLIADFEAKNPNIKVKPELQDGYTNLFKKVTAAINGGGLPDLAVSYESMVSEYQTAGVVVPLEPYINAQKYGLSQQDLDDFYPLYITSNQYPEYKGQMLSFPFTKSVLLMYYNADKLKEAGLQVPTTWDDFAAACKKFTGDVKGYAIGIDASTFNGAVYSRGGTLINETQTQWQFNGQAGQDHLAMLQDLVKSGAAYQVEKQYADQTAFGAGTVVFTFGSSSGLGFYKQEVDKGAKFNWNVALIPQGKNNPKPATTSYGANIAVFKQTPERQLASWLFVKYFTTAPVNADWSTASGYLPIRKSAAEAEVVRKQFDALPPYKVAVTEIQQHGRPETTVKGTQDTRKFIEDAMIAAIADPNRKPKEILDEAAQKGNEALKQSR